MTEQQLQNKIVRYLKQAGLWHWKFQDKFSAGFPDLMIAKDGKILFVELKRPNGKPTKLQAAVHEQMRKHGLDVVVVDGVDKFMAKLEVRGWI